MPNHKNVHNHIGTIHAIAMCNLAEITAGVMTDVSIPAGWRWIPIGMSAKYLAKAKTDLRAIADGSAIDWKSPGDKDVPVHITDTSGQEVCTAHIHVKIGP